MGEENTQLRAYQQTSVQNTTNNMDRGLAGVICCICYIVVFCVRASETAYLRRAT
jgi:hypothetical protein